MKPNTYCTLCGKAFDKSSEVIEVKVLGPVRRLHGLCWYELTKHQPLNMSDQELLDAIEEQEFQNACSMEV